MMNQGIDWGILSMIDMLVLPHRVSYPLIAYPVQISINKMNYSMGAPTKEVAKDINNVQAQSEKLGLLDRFPARLELGLIHQAANKFGVPVYSYQKVCACCDSHVYVKEINCCADLTSIPCDPGVTILFNFIRMTVFFLAVFFLIGSSYNLYTNAVGGQCGNPAVPALVKCHPDISLTLSPVNKLLSKPTFFYQQFFVILTVLACIIFFVLYRKIHYDAYMAAQVLIQNQEEYTLYISEIPVVMKEVGSVNYQTKLADILTAEIDDWIARNENAKGQPQVPPGQPGPGGKLNYPRIYNQWITASQLSENIPYNNEEKIVDVHLCWDTREMTQLMRLKQETKKNIEGISASLPPEGEEPGSDDPSAQQMVTNMRNNRTKYFNHLNSINSEYLRLCLDYKNDEDYSAYVANFLGKAFVCFQYQHYAQVIRIMMKRQEIKMQGNVLKGVWAPSPKDVNWQNLSIGYWVRRKKQFISLLILIGAILFSLAIQIGFKLFQKTLIPATDKPSRVQTRQIFIIGHLMSLVSTQMIYFVNALIINRATTQLIIYEKHESVTDEQNSFIWKSLIAQFINTCIIVYFTNYLFPTPLWSPQGIVTSVSSMIFTLGANQLFFKFVNFNYWSWKISNFLNANCFNGVTLETPVFQDNFNVTQELPSYDIGSVYSELLLGIYTAAFFSYVAPWASIFLAVSTLIGYFVNKCQITRQSSLKTHYSYDMSTEALKLLQFVPFVFVLGHILFSYMFDSPSWILWVALVITILYPLLMNNMDNFLYIRLMSTWLRCEKFSYGYCQANKLFNCTYVNSNPMTKFDEQNSTEEYMTLEQAQQYLLNMPKDQEPTTPQYEVVVRNQQLQQQLQQQQKLQQSQPQGNASGQWFNQSQGYQPVPQR